MQLIFVFSSPTLFHDSEFHLFCFAIIFLKFALI